MYDYVCLLARFFVVYNSITYIYIYIYTRFTCFSFNLLYLLVSLGFAFRIGWTVALIPGLMSFSRICPLRIYGPRFTLKGGENVSNVKLSSHFQLGESITFTDAFRGIFPPTEK